MRKLKLKLKKRKCHYDIIMIFCLLFSCYPFVFNRMIELPGESTILIAFLLILGVFFLKKPKFYKTIPPFLTKCIGIQCIFWCVYFFIHRDSSYITRLLMIVISFLSLHLLISRKNLFKFTSLYNCLICGMALLGIPVFFLYALGIISPIAEFTNVDGRTLYFFGPTCSNAILAGICRVAGFFDEPGALAFWGIIALLFNKLFFDNKKVEFGLIIGLLTTLSAAYFVQLLMYIILFYGGKIKNLVVIVFLLGTIGIMVYKMIGDNAQLARLTIERFEGGTIRSERSNLTVDAREIFKSNPILGVGAKNLQEIGYFADNPYEIPAKDGIVGLIVTYLPLFVVAFRYGRKNKKLLFAILILVAGYLQRPFHINVLHFLILYLFAALAYYRYERKVISI